MFQALADAESTVHGCAPDQVHFHEIGAIDSLVDVLPHGIDSNIGVNGNALSLGQRQRVILARLFLERPQLILLDEVTANLDLELEAKIMENIYSYIDEDSILILISHRKPLGANFNKSYKLNDGFLNQLDNI